MEMIIKRELKRGRGRSEGESRKMNEEFSE
jgi:hypothetical protein